VENRRRASHRRRTRHDCCPAGLVREGGTDAAYRRLSRAPGHLDKVGESFFTKWLWIASTGFDVSPRPLILDEQVMKSLLALQWREDVRGYGKRYIAYLDQADQWATFLGVDPETIERALFEAGGEL
jgi:hypothetical protein